MLRIFHTHKRGVPSNEVPTPSSPGGEDGGENVRITSEGETRITSEAVERVIE